MLLVKTKIAPSNINGIGLFADEFIPKGTVTWRSISPFDLKVDAAEIEKLAPPARELFMKYSYLSRWSGKYVLCFDDARFLNHSDNPNFIGGSYDGDGEETVDIAARDIYPGEEITCDYRTFDIDCERGNLGFREAPRPELVAQL
jgi:SET domain-containing protein